MLKILCSQKEISFQQDLTLNIAEIDVQHERLFILCQTATDLKYSGTLQIEALLLEIESYISEHLSFEEQILKKTDLEIYTHHKQLHDQFREKYFQINKKHQFLKEDPTQARQVSVELATLLKEWLCQHILKVDRQHRSHFQGRKHLVTPRSPRIKVNVRALLEMSRGRGLTCLVIDVSDSGALLHFQAVPNWIKADETALLHIIPLVQCNATPCRIVHVAVDDIRVEFLEKHSCNLYTAMVQCKT
ncbi:Hemerythrin [Candidatus Magnetaquicoccaceae bacterium FCR-1]|uniref:Hemerythrin n=1 Tax=Candidatus Magnetaquiglobus chichijimensis TaxID=3141448 RepID=A0ABQ0CAH7_9PROT